MKTAFAVNDSPVDMTAEGPTPQEARIEELREQIKKLGGSTLSVEDMPADMEEEFLRHVLEYETAGPISIARLIENSGRPLPIPAESDDAKITEYLLPLIQHLATLGVYLLHTNHLSDRELYEYLYNDGLREEAVLFPENPTYAYIIDLTGSGSEEDNNIYLKYYATEEKRLQWHMDWPDDVIPAHETAPYDRDKDLPQSPLL